MKSFYGGTYIGREILEENHIYHPVRLEYYKIEQEHNNQLFYGIEVVKTEYKKAEPEVEIDSVEFITIEETEIIEMLEKFKTGTVMPSILKEMVEENSKSKRELYFI